MLSYQADKLRKYAERLHHLANGNVNQGFPARQDLFESAAEMREAADTIEELSAKLQGMVGTRWSELFGTPERAARTLTHVCQFTHGGELCDRCQCYLFDKCNRELRLMSERPIYDALLEWLRGDA